MRWLSRNWFTKGFSRGHRQTRMGSWLRKSGKILKLKFMSLDLVKERRRWCCGSPEVQRDPISIGPDSYGPIWTGIFGREKFGLGYLVWKKFGLEKIWTWIFGLEKISTGPDSYGPVWTGKNLDWDIWSGKNLDLDIWTRKKFNW